MGMRLHSDHRPLFRALFAFVIVELGSRRVAHVEVTSHPTHAWVAQQVREATPFGQGPRYLPRDNDRKYGQHAWAVTEGSGIEVLKTPIVAPRSNTICERFVGSVRRECLDHMLIFNKTHLRHVMKDYVAYFNDERLH
jgi:putative transposase